MDRNLLIYQQVHIYRVARNGKDNNEWSFVDMKRLIWDLSQCVHPPCRNPSLWFCKMLHLGHKVRTQSETQHTMMTPHLMCHTGVMCIAYDVQG